MPELAEVETVRNVLKKSLINKKINKVKVIYPGMIENDIDEFCSKLENQIIEDIKRIGKWLIFETTNYYLLSHLRMEGKYFIKDVDEGINKHEHVIFYIDDFTLRYHDVRKFGKMHLINKEDLYTCEEISKMGLEANSTEISPKYLFEKLQKKNIPIKTGLLDQTIISGLGNIYVDEVLFASKISPLRNCNDVNIEECNDIILNSKVILDMAIKCGGTTIRSYTSSLGVEGNYQNYLKVHQKRGQNCQNCGTIIEKIKVGGRGTYYCHKCQK